jgi:hypothetical protein
MFHAKRSSRLYLGYHDVIVFDHVEKNVGGGYDGKSGKFTATIKGLYLFSTRVDTIQGKRIHIALVKNGKITSVACSPMTQNYSEDNRSSNTIPTNNQSEMSCAGKGKKVQLH